MQKRKVRTEPGKSALACYFSIASFKRLNMLESYPFLASLPEIYDRFQSESLACGLSHLIDNGDLLFISQNELERCNRIVLSSSCGNEGCCQDDSA